MSVVFDHLTAVVVGVVVLLALATLQIRDRLAAAESAVTSAAESQALTTLDMVSQDLDNTMSETLARTALGAYRCRLARSADGERTVLLEIPTWTRPTASQSPRPAHIEYTLVPEGDSVTVGRRRQPRFSLRRAVDWGSGYEPAQTVARNLTDLDVAFRGRLSQTVQGPPPIRFTGIAVSLDLALPGLARAAADQAAVGSENRAQVSIAVRPPNLTVDA